jgi:hypothetical protein
MSCGRCLESRSFTELENGFPSWIRLAENAASVVPQCLQPVVDKVPLAAFLFFLPNRRTIGLSNREAKIQ